MRRTIEVSLSDSSIHFYISTRHVEKTFAMDSTLVEFLRLLNGNRGVDELLHDLQKVAPEVTHEDVTSVLQVLEEEELIEDAAARPAVPGLTEEEQRRYDRQLAFFEDFASPEAAMLGQTRLRNAHVAIFGVGGLGNWVAAMLAMAGVGEITLCDADRVEASNLTRQGMFRAFDIGRPKVDALADHLLGLNPEIRVNRHVLRVDETTDLRPFLERATLAISCMDEPNTAATGLWVSKFALQRGIPHQIGGGYNGHLGLVGPTILPGKTGCWNCFLASQAPANKQALHIPGLVQKSGAIGPISGIVASFHAWEALRVISGTAPPLMCNRKLELDLNTLQWHSFEFQRIPDCTLCGHLPTAKGDTDRATTLIL